MPEIVLIADDKPAIRPIFRRVLEHDVTFGLCAEAANGKQAIARGYLPRLTLSHPFLSLDNC
jgi:hypothetical protein